MNDVDLEMAQRCGAAWMGEEETADILGISYVEFKEDWNAKGPIFKAYRKGEMLSELAYRESVINLACNGSAPAQELVAKLMHKHKTK